MEMNAIRMNDGLAPRRRARRTIGDAARRKSYSTISRGGWPARSSRISYFWQSTQRSRSPVPVRCRSARQTHWAIHSSIHIGAGDAGRNSLQRQVHGIRSVFIAFPRVLLAVGAPGPLGARPPVWSKLICRSEDSPCGFRVWKDAKEQVVTIGRFMG